MAEDTNKSRRYEISFLNMLFCLIVIFIHITSYLVSQSVVKTTGYCIAVVFSRLSSFVVQGFVMLSGVKLFLTRKDSVSYTKWLKQRFFGIILPYILCFAVYYIYYFFVYDYPLDIKFILAKFFTGDLVCHLYFIPIIVQFDLLLPLWKKIINRCSPIIVVPFCIMISLILGNYFPNMVSIISPDLNFLYNDRLFTTYLSFYIIGCYIGKNYNSFLTVLKNNFKTILVCFVIATLLCTYYSLLSYNNIVHVPFLSQIHNLYVYCAIFLIYSLSTKIAPYLMKKISLINQIDFVSYDIYLWHMLVLLVTDYLIIEKFGVYSLIYAFVIRVIVVYTVTIALCLTLNKLKRRIIN